MPWSDIDLVIALGESGLSSTDILSAMSDLFEIEEIYFADIKYIPGATIPVLKATCTKSFNSIRIDVTVQDGRHNGLKCVELVKVYMTSYESLVHLVLPLKQFIFNSDLNDPYQGGLTSYGLILMIVAFLQLKQRQGADITCKRPNLGILLVDFMNFYMNFDYTGSLIKPFLPNAPLSKMIPYQKRVAQFNEMTQGMHIVDPINPTNNVSRATHRYYILRNIFYIGFCSAFLLSACELKHLNHMKEDSERRHVLLKILSASKVFNLLNNNNPVPRE